MGFPFKVYAAGLYLKETSKNPEEIIASSDPKQIRAIFDRRVDDRKLKEAWKDGIRKNCSADCEVSKQKIHKFNELMVDSKKGGAMIVTFHQDRVELEMDGMSKSSGTVPGAEFSKDLLSVFIGPKPPSEELKNGLLGISKN